MKPVFSSRYATTYSSRIGSRLTPGVLALLGLFTATYLVTLLAPQIVAEWIDRHLLLYPSQVLSWRAYQIVVAPALMTHFFSLLFVGLLLWSIGSAVEQQIGTRKFLSYMAGASGGAALAAALLGRLAGWVWPSFLTEKVVFDGQPVFLAVLVAFAHFFGTLPVRMWGLGEPISGRALSYFFIGLGLVVELWQAQWLQLTASLAAILYMFMLLGSPWPRLRQRLRRMLSRRRSGLTVLSGGRTDPKKHSEPRWLN